MTARPPIYGLLAEFDSPTELTARGPGVQGGRVPPHGRVHARIPIEEVSEAIEEEHSRLPLMVLIGGIVGGIGGFRLCYWTSVIDYPLNVGGRPLNSWPSFIPITFECTILGAALSTVFGMLALNGLPMPYHPVFNVPRFALASRDRFFLCIEATDPQFDRDATRRFLERLAPRDVSRGGALMRAAPPVVLAGWPPRSRPAVAGHAGSAEVQAAGAERLLRRRPRRAPAGGRHRRARAPSTTTPRS